MGFIVRIDGALKKFCNESCLTDKEAKRTITYREFDELSGKVGLKLRSLGICEGEAVIIRIGRCYEYIAAEYGAVRSGAVAIPVLPSYPDARIDYIKKDSNAKLMITEKFFDDIDIFSFDAEGAAEDSFNVDQGEDAENKKRFIFYTSGSTGNPKGVIYRDKAVLGTVERNISEFMLKIKPFIYASSGSMSFTVSIAEYYRNFCIGGHIHILSEETRKDILKVQDYYAQNEISMGFLSPRMLKVYKNKDKALRMIGTGSERVVNTYSKEFTITNGYGQTETIGSFCRFVIDKPYENTPIGKPQSGITIKITDEEGNEVNQGEEGYIIATGNFPYEYNNLPEQTAKTFHRNEDGSVSVHTGDMGRILPDGNLLFVNRKDWMLKVHGQRVEPGEIEAVMNLVDGVTNSVVKGFEQEDGSMLLCGFYTGDADKETILKALNNKLPSYMVPGILVNIEKFPVNPNGKVDRLALEKPDLSLFREEYEAPSNELEEKLCKAMEEVLGIPNIGRNDDFFMLGGNSINSVILVDACNIKGLSVKHVMLGKTPKNIIDSFTNSTTATKPELNKTDKSKLKFEMTNAQKYQLNECDKIGCLIDMNDFRGFWKIEKGIDIEKLKQAVGDSFAESKGMNVSFDIDKKKMIKTDRKPVVEEITIKGEDFKTYRREKSKIKRDLLNDELYELSIIHCDDDDYLYININHLLYDESSLKNLLDEVKARYENDEFAKEDIDIFDLSEYEQRIKNSDYYREAIDYHRGLYSRISTDNLPAKGEKQDHGAHRKVAPELSREAVEHFLKKSGVSEIIYLQAAFVLALSKTLMKSKELTYMTVYDGRIDPKYRAIKGVLAQSLYMYAEIDEQKTVKEFLDEIQNTYQTLSYYGSIDVVDMAETFPNIRNDIYLNFRGSMDIDFEIGGKKCKFENIGMFFDDYHVWTRLNFLVDYTQDRHYAVSCATGYYDENVLNSIIDEFEHMLVRLTLANGLDELV